MIYYYLFCVLLDLNCESFVINVCICSCCSLLVMPFSSFGIQQKLGNVTTFSIFWKSCIELVLFFTSVFGRILSGPGGFYIRRFLTINSVSLIDIKLFSLFLLK